MDFKKDIFLFWGKKKGYLVKFEHTRQPDKLFGKNMDRVWSNFTLLIKIYEKLINII